MAGSSGYYSLIQYCPDRSRLEVANVGVLLYCPELSFLKTRMDRGNDRVRRIFGVSGADLGRIDEMKKAIGERVEVENQSFPTIEDLQQFVATRGNDIVITQLRPMKVVAPDSDLENLFKELVGERERSSHDGERSHIPELDREMQSDRIRQKLKLNLRIQLPIFERPILIPYAFRNGKLNLIKPQRFSSEKTALSIASALAVDGSLLARYPADGLSRELIVVSSFDDASRPLRPKVGELLDSFRVRHVPIENIGSLIREIEQQGHDE